MRWLRILALAALIAFGPAFTVLVIVFLTSDPAEGANIGGGIIALGVLAISTITALVFVAWHILQASRSK